MWHCTHYRGNTVKVIMITYMVDICSLLKMYQVLLSISLCNPQSHLWGYSNGFIYKKAQTEKLTNIKTSDRVKFCMSCFKPCLYKLSHSWQQHIHSDGFFFFFLFLILYFLYHLFLSPFLVFPLFSPSLPLFLLFFSFLIHFFHMPL